MKSTMTKQVFLQVAAMFGTLALTACGGSSSGTDQPTVSVVGKGASTGNGSASSTATSVTATDPLMFSSSNYSIAQSAGSVTLTVLRVGSADAAVSVNYSTVDGTAIAGTDYTAMNGTLEWAANDSSSKTIDVPLNAAAPFGGNKTFSVGLSNPSATAQIASPDSAVVTIAGDAVATAGSLQFSSSSYTVAQNSTQLVVTVTRTTASGGTTSVTYATTGGTAVAGTDFTAEQGTLTWTDGDAASKSFVVPISNANAFSGTKSFGLTLSNPASGAMLGTPSTASVVISGGTNAVMGSLHLAATSYTVDQSAGTVTVTVDRTGGSSGAVSVAYASANGTATAGKDYTRAAGTLTWSDGDGSPKSFTTAISGTTAFSGSKSFTVALSSPGNGVTIGSPSNATVTITGNGAAAVGSLQLAAATYVVAQNAGQVAISVDRGGGSAGTVSVDYATTDGSAKSGADFTAVQGSLTWNDGDAAPKVVSIRIGNATAFSGSRTFSFSLTQPNGAEVGTPASAVVTINGNGSGSGGAGGPSAPSGLTMTGQSANSVSLAWGAPGGSISHYKIYRNGASYATSTSTRYTDANATGATNDRWTGAANVYAYAVSAVDSNGVEGPQTTQTTFQIYTNGVFNFAGDYSYDSTANYKDTDGGPESGPYDIGINVWKGYGGFQPYAGNVVPQWDLEIGSFGYIVLDLKPTIQNQTWRLSLISRLPPGDVYPWSQVNVTDYGPAPVVGKWATYKIPLTALSIGKTHFEGYISGTTLTVTHVDSGVGVDAGGFISGNGVAPGTYIVGHNANGGPGTYTISPSQYVSSTSMTEQRTSLYKPNLQDTSGAGSNQFYIDNFKFTTQ